jgi:hypothetical protein
MKISSLPPGRGESGTTLEMREGVQCPPAMATRNMAEARRLRELEPAAMARSTAPALQRNRAPARNPA